MKIHVVYHARAFGATVCALVEISSVVQKRSLVPCTFSLPSDGPWHSIMIGGACSLYLYILPYAHSTTHTAPMGHADAQLNVNGAPLARTCTTSPASASTCAFKNLLVAPATP